MTDLPLATVRELLKQQREDFSAMINSVLKSFQDRYDTLHITVNDLKHSLDFAHKEIDSLKKQCDEDKELKTSQGNEIDNLKFCLYKLDDKTDYIENQSRRNNVRFDGVLESARETWDETEKKVTKLLSTNMKFQEVPPIERAHRVGPKKADKPRSIVVKFANYKGREAVLRSGKLLKGSNIFAREDLSERVMARRKEQMEAMKAARNLGKLAYFSYDKLVIRERPLPLNPSQNHAAAVVEPHEATVRVTRSQSSRNDQEG